MVCTKAKMRSSAPGGTAVTPAGSAGGVKTGRTKSAAPLVPSKSSIAAVEAGPNSRTAVSHRPQACSQNFASATVSVTLAAGRASAAFARGSWVA